MASVLVAPDSFKGTFSAVEVAEAIGRGLASAGLEAELCPVADGGEGTMETLLASIGGERIDEDVRDPWAATTYGTGELIRAAADAGADEIMVAVGGSATVDGGRGALEAIE